MRLIIFVISAFFCSYVLDAQNKPLENQKGSRIEKVINSQWTFNYFPKVTADKGYESPAFDDSAWPAISLPHTWSTYETTGELNPFIMSVEERDNPYWWTGWGWYRKHFSIKNNYSDKKVFVVFKGVNRHCKVWINGKFIGENKSDSTSFDFDITQFIKQGEDNLLAVAVNNKLNDQFMSPTIPSEDKKAYGGIIGDVTIVLKNKLFISGQGSLQHNGNVVVSVSTISEKESVVKVQTGVKNDNKEKKSCTLITTISDETNRIVQVIKSIAVIEPGQLYKFDQTSKPIKKPSSSSTADQSKYKVVSEVIDGKVVADIGTNSSEFKNSITKDTLSIFSVSRVLEDLSDENVKDTNETTDISAQSNRTGEPSRIVLTVSHQKIPADRGSVAIITADIFDSNGTRVKRANNSVKWRVTGPGTLVGPAIYESEINKHHQNEGVWYTTLPVSNVIRSNGKPGKIRIVVSASGLAAGTLDIEAEETKSDNSVILEPILTDEGRNSVTRKLLKSNRLEEIPREIKTTSDEFNNSTPGKPGYAGLIKDYILKNNSATDTSTIEFKALINLYVKHLINNSGRLTADDYNFTVANYNNCRLISGYINSTKLPPLFKEGLRKYYANAIIALGSEKNAGEEMNWLNWIPSGGTVVISREGSGNVWPKGTIVTNKSQLADLIAAVHPVFVNYSDEAKERALTFISKMNPYIRVSGITYTAEKGQPILIPLLKFISE